MRRSGGRRITRFRFFEAEFSPPFALDHTQAYVMAGDEMVITAFRGTEIARILDWLSDSKAPMAPQRNPGLLGGPADKGKGYAADITALEPDADGATDHFIDAYITCLEAANR
ncbi:hypothetical protein [Allonocardiopsis opalescens]|uniref:Uncharacterized protein n=1 Tax=Allonocardiopsis opalescens TaxID=1144618 RepID=A0A2T0Q1K0_9ACTN|nr:hypothetical protein [Allonocardiopsis opalescens]PRX97675.1 hypothetical protein CLV72_10525 [Allonocardiopsis opalescens]